MQTDYVGDKLLQKRAPKDFLTKQPEKNVAFESAYLMEDHEGIIDRETWETVQAKLAQRHKELDQGEKGYHGGRTHFLYGKVFCADCGTPMTRRTLRCSSKKDNKETYKAWTCKERHKGRQGNGCKMRTIRENELLAEIARQMGCADGTEFPVKWFLREIERVLVSNEKVLVTWNRNSRSA